MFKFRIIINKYRILLYSVSILLFVFSLNCSKKQIVITSNSLHQEFYTALNFLQAKQYNKAIPLLQNIIFNYPNTSYAADAQFYLADAYFQKKDYYSAIQEFELFINNFPVSQYQEDAIYKLALCYYNIAPSVIKDQNHLAKALDVLVDLQERFPQTKYQSEVIELKQKIYDRWAEKNFRIGELYYKGEEYNSARIYFDYVNSEFPNSKWSALSKFYIGQIYERTDSIAQAIAIYQQLLKDTTNIALQKMVGQRLVRLEKKNR